MIEHPRAKALCDDGHQFKLAPTGAMEIYSGLTGGKYSEFTKINIDVLPDAGSYEGKLAVLQELANKGYYIVGAVDRGSFQHVVTLVPGEMEKGARCQSCGKAPRGP